MASSLDAKQMKQLLQSISTDPQLRQSKDSILLAEDQYPDALDAIITKLRTPTTLQNTINLLQWDRRIVAGYDAELRAATIISQNSMRAKYQLVPTRDNPWDTYTFRQWKYFVTNLCLFFSVPYNLVDLFFDAHVVAYLFERFVVRPKL